MKSLTTILICCLFMFSLVQAQEAEKNINKGNEFYKKQQFDQAAKEYEKIPEDDSVFSIAQFNLGNALYKAGKKDDATQTFTKLIKNEKNSIQSSKLNYNIGVILSSRHKLEASIEAYKNALLQNPNDKEARENLQKALLELKKKTPPPPKEDKKRKQQPQSKMNQKEASQKLKELEQKEKKVQQKMQNQNTSGGAQRKDW